MALSSKQLRTVHTCGSAARTARPHLNARVSAAARNVRSATIEALLKRPTRAVLPLGMVRSSSTAGVNFSTLRSMTTAAAATDVATVFPASLQLVGGQFPRYDEVKAEDVVPAMREVLQAAEAELAAMEANINPTWSGLVEELERITDRQQCVWSVVEHLKAVKDSEPLRKAVEEIQPEVVAFGLRLAQSKPLYEGFQKLKDSAEYESLDKAQKQIITNELRDFVLGGVALEGEKKERFNAIQQELAKLSTKFTNNVMDSTKAFKKLITDATEVEGLPKTALGLAAQQAKQAGHEEATPENGPWLFTLDFPSYFPIMTHAKNRALREELYNAFITRASTGDLDNGPVAEKILTLRREKAQLLGYPTYADLSMASKMATLPEADKLMEDLRAASYKAAESELEEVREFARSQGVTEELKWWDLTFWSERLRESKFNITDEELRPYFALPNVLDGLFQLANRLFGVEVQAADGEAAVWHPDVRFFKLLLNGEPKAYFYLDPYSRPAEKRGGAWMDVVVGQSKVMAPAGARVRLPVAHMVCNQSPPIADSPSLMTFREVETLFHEFGHALQHMMTTVDHGLVSGLRGVEWDAVELPSQFMENWCYDKKTLYGFAKHYETGEPLPEDIYKRLLAAKTFRSGSMTLRQVHFACIDLDLHARFTPGEGESIFERDQKLAQKTQVLPPNPADRFLCSFNHIFAGGYSAGYYSYKWAEVLSADAFSAFEEAGLDNEKQVQETGYRFRDTVLGLGGSLPAAEVFKLFRGRQPTPDALLRHSNLVPSVA